MNKRIVISVLLLLVVGIATAQVVTPEPDMEFIPHKIVYGFNKVTYNYSTNELIKYDERGGMTEKEIVSPEKFSFLFRQTLLLMEQEESNFTVTGFKDLQGVRLEYSGDVDGWNALHPETPSLTVNEPTDYCLTVNALVDECLTP